MKPLFLLLFLALVGHSPGGPPQPAVMPYAPNIIQDKKGNEWYIEQNGALQRNGSQPSMIGNGMMLHMGTQQFYSQQPMVSQDGSEITMATPQPMNGLTVTRHITILEREGALRYVEEFSNTTGRDMTFPVEIRHAFNNQNKSVLSDTGRPIKDTLQSGESGVLITANSQEKAPDVLLVLCAPGTQTPPRISTRSNYQFSVFYNLTIPAGQTTTLIHAIAQAKVGATSKPEVVAKAFQPFQMRRLISGLSKSTIKSAANLAGTGRDFGLEDWFPARYWDIAPEASDILLLDDASRLKGRAGAAPAVLTSAMGEIKIAWENVAAFAGPGFTMTGQSWLWLRDGQRWKGALDVPSLKFTLVAGAELDLPRPNRIILRRTADPTPPKPTHAILETWSGERVAFAAEGSLNLDTPWGSLTAPWSDILVFSPADTENLGGMLHLRDGSHLRVLPAPQQATLKTKDFGARPFDFAQMRRAITPQAATAPADDSEPPVSFIDLSGDQRLVCRVTSPKLRFLTPSGPVDLAPAAIRELHLLLDEDTPNAPSSPRFQAEVWGGGTLTGGLDNTELKIEGRGFAWQLPLSHLTRIVNPVPVADTALMRRTGELIQSLGDPQWKTRERASTELRELGPLAKPSLQEALKQSTDAEVTRRLETLLSELD